MRDWIIIMEGTISLTGFVDLAKQCPTVEEFIRRTDGMEVLYRGHSGGPVPRHSFYTDYIGHASHYGELIDARAYDPRDVLFFNDMKFDEMRGYYRRASEWDEENFRRIYNDSLADNPHAEQLIDHFPNVANVIMGDDDIPYHQISQNYSENDAFIPLMLHFASLKGKNIIAFHGGDYADYGGQTEYVVRDPYHLVDLRALYDEVSQG